LHQKPPMTGKMKRVAKSKKAISKKSSPAKKAGKKKSFSSRSYSATTLKKLWGRAAGRCAVPECRIELFAEATDYDPIVPIGDIAHIRASSDSGPRANKKISKRERDEYENLILLCKNCHARLDKQKNSNPVEKIVKLKMDHEDWVRTSLPERGQSTNGWTGIVIQGRHPIDQQRFPTAISPDWIKEPLITITADPEEKSWEEIFRSIDTQVKKLLRATDPHDCRFAIFPLAPISACITLGYLLTNRPRVRLFQYHRDPQSWQWPDVERPNIKMLTLDLPARPSRRKGELAICFNVSARVTDYQISTANKKFAGVVKMSVSTPSTGWLKSELQLKELAKKFREVFENCAQLFPRCHTWNLFCAVPAPVAVAIGQQLNPTMTPKVQLYEFQRPSYYTSLTLGG